MEKIEYEHPDLVVIWQPKLCRHTGICVKMLPKVYDPKGRPWLKPEMATKEELTKQIDSCPSGALTYRLKN